MLSLLALSCLTAIQVDTTLLGSINGPQPAITADAQGNVLLVGNVPCSILQDCQPISLVKLDPAGRVLFRRGLGDASWRFQPTAVTLDAAGNITLAGTTTDPNLPTVRPVQARLAGGSDLYLHQLSPDASRTLFATYLGGSANENFGTLQPDASGHLLFSAVTASANFPFTAADAPAPATSAPRLAALRLAPATGQLVYAINLPGQANLTTFGTAPDGTAVFSLFDPQAAPTATRNFAFEIKPDGSRRSRPLGLPNEAQVQRVVPSPDGGLWATGITFAAPLPITPNAWQPPSFSSNYVRAEGPSVLTPPGPMRSWIVRQLAVDRRDENILYASTSQGLARTTDNGWTWELVNTSAPLRNLLALAASAGRLWAVTLAAPPTPALLYSDDGGSTWTNSTFPIATSAGPLLLAAHPTRNDTLYLSAGPALYRTTDAGETWTQRSFPESVITALAADEAAVAIATAPGTASRRAAVYLTADGLSFPAEGLSLPTPPQALRFDPNAPGSLYFSDLAERPRLLRTDPAQFPRFDETPIPSVPFVQFGFQAGLPGAILALGLDGSVYRSEDAGRSFRPAGPPPDAGQFAIQFTVAAGGVVHLAYIANPEPFLAKITAAGQVEYFSYLGIRRLQSVVGFHVSPTGRAVIAGQMDGVFRFPGEILRGALPGAPPGFVPATTASDLFAIAIEPDGTLAYAVALSGSGPEVMSWSGLGANNSLILAGLTFSPDFPGLSGGGAAFQSSLFLSRLRP